VKSADKTTVSDVCLILEGTYPYITGGVSEWTHRLIGNLPDVTFHLLCLVPSESQRSWAYPKPTNVIGQTDVALTARDEDRHGLVFSDPIPDRKAFFGSISEFHRRILGGEPSVFRDLYSAMEDVHGSPGLFRELLSSQDSWEILRRLYDEQFPSESFIDFFWMWRTTHAPLFRVLSVMPPPAKVYHALSTGYAGMLGVMGHLKHGRPLVLTEHGIYTRERKIEIALSEWIGGQSFEGRVIRPVNETIRGFWMRIFEQLGRIVYHHADPIITLFEGNRTIQVRDGADPARIRIIPNGIEIPGAEGAGSKSPEDARVVALVGRVVPIKDVKTFIQAARIVRDQEPAVRFLIVGPTDHDPDYFKECLELVRTLDLGGSLSFTGVVDLKEYYPKIDILVLTSLSEAQPLVVMEAGSRGIPVVAPRVGACEELLTGRTPEDRALGHSGLLTGVGDPNETALAVQRILRDRDLEHRLGMAGRRRMDIFYKEDRVFDAYRVIYREKGSGWPA
jgi:glycosyltransferase involved in cell wall biosynthesis